jgi:hypothetical protein
LDTGGKIDQGGALALADVSFLPEGQLEINLALPWTAESQSHFSITLLDKANSLVHPGDSNRAIEITEIVFR